MVEFGETSFGNIHRLAVGLLEGTLSVGEQQELEDLLLNDPAARRLYLEHMHESACLTWLCVEEFGSETTAASVLDSSAGKRRLKTIGFVTAGLLASLLVLFAGWQFVLQSEMAGRNQTAEAKIAAEVTTDKLAAVGASTDSRTTEPPVVATITAATGAQWGGSSSGSVRVLSRWAVGDRLRLLSGFAELTFDAGAQVTVFGPAEFEITSATSIRCLRGRITTLVDKRGRGFFIETPRAKVVDLGTQFGLTISDKGETEVVVFQGSVDLSYNTKQPVGDNASRRMQQGEALLLKNSGEFERVFAVQRNSFMGSANGFGRGVFEPVIADVQDNIRNAQRPVKSYQIVRGGLVDDALAFVDRFHQWNGLDNSGMPSFLAGADYIMPFNDDKFVRGLEIKVRVLRPAELYVFIDNNMTVPDWLQQDFTDTGVDIGLDCSKTEWHKDHSLGVGSGGSIDFRFSVWKRDVKQAGTVVLGGLSPPEVRSHGFNMFGIAAVGAQ